jgi:outer membrane protein assembly factor BamB
MTGGQMAPTTLMGQTSATSPFGRNRFNGEPMKMAELIASLDGSVYVVSVRETEGTAIGPDGKTSYPKPKLVFSDSIGGSISTPVFANGALVAAGYDKKVHLYRIDYDASDGTPLANSDGTAGRVRIRETGTFTAGAAFESTPLVWGGRVFIGSRDGYLYCLGRR